MIKTEMQVEPVAPNMSAMTLIAQCCYAQHEAGGGGAVRENHPPAQEGMVPLAPLTALTVGERPLTI